MTTAVRPSEWASTELGNLFVHVIGGVWGEDETFEDEGFVSVMCIRGAEFRHWDKEKGSSATHRKIKRSSLDTRRLYDGDILIEISGGGPDQPVGRTALIDRQVLSNHPGKDVICTNFIRLARPVAEISSSYLNNYLRSFYLSGEVVNYQGGSNNLRNLKFKEYATISVPLPPLAEQQQIAARLDALLAQVDTLKTRLGTIPAILKRFRQSVLAAAVSGRLTESDTKIITTIETVAKVIGGLTKNPKRKEFSQIRPYLRVANVYENALRLEDISMIGVEEKELDRVSLIAGDLLVVEGNGSLDQIGRVALWLGAIEGCVHQNHLIKIRPDGDKLISQFALYYLMSPQGKKQIVDRATSGAGLYTLSISKIKSIKVPLFSINEQNKIVRRVEQLFVFADQIEQRVKDAQSRVNHLTKSILAKAFRGELTAEWREENPDLISGESSAGALLERIEKDRANTNLVVKNRKPTFREKTNNPRRDAAMTKSRFDEDVINKPYLASLLAEIGSSHKIGDLFQKSQLPIEDFYKQLAWEVDKGHINDKSSELEKV